MTFAKLMVVETFSGKISRLIALDYQHSEKACFICLRATSTDTLMAKNIPDTLRDNKIRNL